MRSTSIFERVFRRQEARRSRKIQQIATAFVFSVLGFGIGIVVGLILPVYKDEEIRDEIAETVEKALEPLAESHPEVRKKIEETLAQFHS